MKRWFLFSALLCGLTAGRAAEARSVYLNGFDISDLRDQTFEKVKVVIDKDGNIRIEGSQYDVKVSPPSKDAVNDHGGPNAVLTKKYYLVTQPSLGGKTQYDFIVKVNGKERRFIKADGPQLILEISAWLKKGDNEVVIAAAKNLEGGRKSFSANDRASAIIGVGHTDNNIVKIDEVKADVRVDGAASAPIEKRFIITAE
jgi:hypothetical protein